MSVLAHPGPVAFPTRRRHLALVPSPSPVRSGAPIGGLVPAEAPRLADVIDFPVSRRPQPALPVRAAGRREVGETPLRLTARGRVVLAGLAVVAAAAIGSLAGSLWSGAEAAPSLEVVTVSTGDSLWSIAAAVAGPGEDVRDVMSEIAALNQLEGEVLMAGQQLRVPTGD